ncbi:MAG TPA: tetratricopeptide repeat protein [Polyangiaceae bacterium]|nr:tetratricopeptide repeat protein [Polyangiaceae bacterium]
MNDLKPWIEDGAPEAFTELLEAARVEQPSAESLRRSLSAAGAGVVTASTASAMAGATASGLVQTKGSILLTTSVLKWMLVGVGLGGAAVSTVAEVRGRARQLPATAVSALSPSSTRASGSGAARTGTRELPTHTSLLAPASSLTSHGVDSSKIVTPPAEKRVPNDSPAREVPARLPQKTESERLADEIRAIERATRALASGQAAQTLALLDDYDRRYLERRFGPESLFLRMEAFAKAGRHIEARTVAERLIATYPNSPQSTRARAVLSSTIP